MKYIANPVEVDAFQIIGIRKYGDDGAVELELEGADNKAVAGPEMLARIMLQVGDYWVRQSDGYVYLNPKAVFERKYSPTAGKAALEAACAEG